MEVKHKKVSKDQLLRELLRMVGRNKDGDEAPICNEELRYYGRTKGYLKCIKCYPEQSLNKEK